MDLVFEDLTETERRIHALREEIGYVMLCEVVDRNNDRALGKAMFNNAHLGSFLHDDRPPLSRQDRPVMPSDDESEGEHDEELDEDEPEEDEADEEGEPQGLADLGLADATLPTLEQLAQAATRWIKYTCAANMVGEAARQFKVRVFTHKGHRTLYACRFLVRDLDRERDAKLPVATVPTVPVPAATVPAVQPLPTKPDNSPEARTWRALGDAYTNLVGLLQPSYAHLANLQNTTIGNQNEQILRLQGVVEKLTGEVVRLRVGIAEVDHVERQEAGEAKLREALGKQFISELGAFGRVVASAKLGMSPELAELAEVVNGSPELLEALGRPEVRVMLRDEKSLRELAALLKTAANVPDDPPSAGQAPKPAA